MEAIDYLSLNAAHQTNSEDGFMFFRCNRTGP